MFERGFLMVNLWWIRGELWLVNGHFSGAKNMPHFQGLFFGIPVLGNDCNAGSHPCADLHGWDAIRRLIGMEAADPRAGGPTL
jgi:hypothetical protein